MKYKISCIGNQWRGSDDGSIFRAFLRDGHLIDIIDDKMYIPGEVTSTPAKAVRKLGLPYFLSDYNKTVIRRVKSFEPDIVCVYKGASLAPEALQEIKKTGVPVFNIFPDISFFEHGPRIPQCVPLYDFIFTTKSFGAKDLKDSFGYTKVALINHCADPEVHRPINPTIRRNASFSCDVSFIGSYSKKKGTILRDLAVKIQDLDLKIWGAHWELAGTWPAPDSIKNQTVLGDGYAYAINSSKINLGLLMEGRSNPAKDDQLTSRTFHIPGAGGFLLHERNEEFSDLFIEGKEAEAFEGIEELTEKVRYYLQHEETRKDIAHAGHEKVMKFHTSDHRVKEIFSTLHSNGVIK